MKQHPHVSICRTAVDFLTCLCVSECKGMSNQLTLLGSHDNHYNNMVKLYSNCSVVLENLEITYTLEHHDLSFLNVGVCHVQWSNSTFSSERIEIVHLLLACFSPSRRLVATSWSPWTRCPPSRWGIWGWFEVRASTMDALPCWWCPTTRTIHLQASATPAGSDSCCSATWPVGTNIKKNLKAQTLPKNH